MMYEMYVVFNHITKQCVWLYPSQKDTFIKSIQILFMYFIFLYFIIFTFNEAIFCFVIPGLLFHPHSFVL